MGVPARAPRAASLGIDRSLPTAMLSRWAGHAHGARLAAGPLVAPTASPLRIRAQQDGAGQRPTSHAPSSDAPPPSSTRPHLLQQSLF
jgi:hypothetical protein